MGEIYEAGHWSVDMELNLFHAMRGHKPVGVNRHFNMVAIHEKMTNPNTKKLTARNVWDHLSTMYDLQALNESEIVPFPNKQLDFKLPNGEYTQLVDADFPRMHKVATVSPTEEFKTEPEGQAKGGKSSKYELKMPHTGKSDNKSSASSDSKSKADSKGGTQTSSKQDSKSATPLPSRAEGKGVKVGNSSTPDPSPAKRTKRSRNTPSSTASSPASEGASSAKRRR